MLRNNGDGWQKDDSFHIIHLASNVCVCVCVLACVHVCVCMCMNALCATACLHVCSMCASAHQCVCVVVLDYILLETSPAGPA